MRAGTQSSVRFASSVGRTRFSPQGMREVWLLILALFSQTLFSQTSPGPVFVESFRKGSTKIKEQTLQISLDVKNPTYEANIPDSDGDSHFMISLSPLRVGQEDPSI